PPTMSGIPFIDPVFPATGPLTPIAYTMPTAIDQVDGATPVSCSPASGSGFPVGSTPVTCTTSDTRGNNTCATFTINVHDAQPPVITLGVPAVVTVPATSSLGAVFTFSPTANDAVDGPRPVTCAPPSGSTFPLGATAVDCQATDLSANTAHA